VAVPPWGSLGIKEGIFGELSRLDPIDGGGLLLAAAGSFPSLGGKPSLLNLPYHLFNPLAVKPGHGFKETMGLRKV